MTINDYIDACIHFNSDTQLWHKLDPAQWDALFALVK